MINVVGAGSYLTKAEIGGRGWMGVPPPKGPFGELLDLLGDETARELADAIEAQLKEEEEAERRLLEKLR